MEEEKRLRRNEYQREYMRKRIASMTPEEKRAYLDKKAASQKRRCAVPSSLEKMRRNSREYERRKRASMSPEERAVFLERRRIREIDQQRARREANREYVNAQANAYYWQEPSKRRERQKRYRQAEKRDVMSHYGGECACCGENELVFLTIDHIKGDGKEHRSSDRGATLLYRWLKKNGYPDGFQVLCWNCNTAKRRLSECPHGSLLKERFVLLRHAVLSHPIRGEVTQ